MTTDLILSRFASTRKEAIFNFIEFINIQSDLSVDTKNIMEAFKSGFYGNDDVIKEMTPMNKEKIQLPKIVLPLNEALILICHQFQISLKDLSSDSKQKNLVDARSALALIGRIGQQEWNLQDVATLLNKNHGSISRLASKAKSKPSISNYVQNLISS